MFIIYTPPLHVVFGGSFHLSPLYWLIPAAFGCVLLAWASLRVVLMRKGLEKAKVKDIKGLMMCKFHFLVYSERSSKRMILVCSPYNAYNEHTIKNKNEIMTS